MYDIAYDVIYYIVVFYTTSYAPRSISPKKRTISYVIASGVQHSWNCQSVLFIWLMTVRAWGP